MITKPVQLHFFPYYRQPTTNGIGIVCEEIVTSEAGQEYQAVTWVHPNKQDEASPSAVNELNYYEPDHEAFPKEGEKRVFVIPYSYKVFGKMWGWSFLKFLRKKKRKEDALYLLMHQPFDSRLLKKPLRWPRLIWQILSFVFYSFAADEIFATTEQVVKVYSKWLYSARFLPLPSSLKRIQNPNRAQNLRKAFARKAECVFGTFGSFDHAATSQKLEPLIPLLLQGHEERFWLFIGRGGEEFMERMQKLYPALADQMGTSDELDTAASSAHMQACDLMVQLYPDGVNGSRTSAMAGLSHGIPTVCNRGSSTEGFWNDIVCLSDDENEFLQRKSVEALIYDPQMRKRYGQAGQQYYENHLSIKRFVNIIAQLAEQKA